MDSRVGGEIRVRGYARSLSPAHSQKIARGHNIKNAIKWEDTKHTDYGMCIKNNLYKIYLKPPKKPSVTAFNSYSKLRACEILMPM